jgi:hypothetical protein
MVLGPLQAEAEPTSIFRALSSLGLQPFLPCPEALAIRNDDSFVGPVPIPTLTLTLTLTPIDPAAGKAM